MSERKGRGVSTERAVRYVLELGWATFGFAVAVTYNRKLVSKICELVFKKYKVEPKCRKSSKRYLNKCLKLALRNRYAREIFRRIGLLFLLTAPFKALETPEIREYIEKLSHVLEEIREYIEKLDRVLEEGDELEL